MNELSVTADQLHNLVQLMKRLTPEQYDLLMQQAKPHVTRLEEEIQKIEYGELDLKMVIRAGVIEKMEFFERKTWLRPKE